MARLEFAAVRADTIACEAMQAFIDRCVRFRRAQKGSTLMTIDPVFIGIWLVIGAIAGWLASLIVTGVAWD